MTCFWDSVIHGLHIEKEFSPSTFISYLKSNNRKTSNVLINQTSLREQEKKENYEAIQELKLGNGYWCSTADPVLCLVAELKNIKIRHDLNGTTTMYETRSAEKVLHLSSSSSHCSLSRGI